MADIAYSEPTAISCAPASGNAPRRPGPVSGIVPAQVTAPAVPADNGDAAGGEETSGSFVYALGRIEPRFPSLDMEKEFVQATGRADTAGLSDRAAAQDILSQRQNRYLARRLCWVLTVEGIETYLLIPTDPEDIDMLIESVRPSPDLGDVDCVIGIRGPVAPPEMCNGLMVPVVAVTQIYSFDVNSMVGAIPKPAAMDDQRFEGAAKELFLRIMQMADNAGATDEHRALNYVAMRYPAIYETAVGMFNENCTLTSVETRPSRLSGIRNIVQVIFSYTNRQTDVTDKYFCRVDVTGEFPFLHSKLGPFYDR